MKSLSDIVKYCGSAIKDYGSAIKAYAVGDLDEIDDKLGRYGCVPFFILQEIAIISSSIKAEENIDLLLGTASFALGIDWIMTWY